jgi:transcriptional regulator with XRE-family HTH domain
LLSGHKEIGKFCTQPFSGDKIMESLPTNLVIARKSKGWTLQDASANTGYKIVTIGSYERGYRLPPVNVLQKLAANYGTSVAWLLGEECQTCLMDTYVKELENQITQLKEATNGNTLRN